MKNKLSYFVFTIALFTQMGVGLAHALYIDTKAEGTLGEAQEVNIYYSEFADRTHEKVADWYSNVAEFQLWLISPNGQRIQLETSVHDNHFAARFVPQTKGVYRLEINHTAAAVADGTAYQFNTYAQVVVGETKANQLPVAEGQDLVLIEKIEPQNNAKKTYQVFFKGAPKAGISTTLFLPSGETKKFETNAKGVFSFQPKEEGIYFLEATTYHENEAGNTQKEAYNAIWRCATQKFEL